MILALLKQFYCSVKDDKIYSLDRWFDGLDYSNVFSKVIYYIEVVWLKVLRIYYCLKVNKTTIYV